jgi:hypothetical protein
VLPASQIISFLEKRSVRAWSSWSRNSLLVDLVGELHRGLAVDQREGGVDLGIEPQIICSISSL